MGCTTGLEYVKIFVIGNINQCYNAAGAARTNNFFNLKLKSERGKFMKKYAKFAGILLALVMLVALIPMTALADEPSSTSTPDGSGTVVLPSPPITNLPYEERKDCDVVISKAVEGNDANVNDEFEFEVTFYMPKGEYEPPIAYSANAAAPVRAPGAGNDIGIYKRFANGDTYAFGPGELTYEDNVSYEGLKKATLHFTLKHGESLTILNAAAKNRPITVKELDSKGYLTTVNGMIGTQWKDEEPVADTIRVNFINTKDSLPLSESLSVEKRWSDGNEKHMRESVTVQLYRNGEPYSFTMFGRVIDDGRVELSAANGWQHTWRGLDTGYKWTVAELNVPKGYVSTVNYYGGSAIITNTAVSAGLPQTGDAQMPYIGAGLVLAAMAIVVIIAGKKRN